MSDGFLDTVTQIADVLTGVDNAYADTTPEALEFIKKHEGGIQKTKKGKVISNAGIEHRTYKEYLKDTGEKPKKLEDLNQQEIDKIHKWYFKDVPYEKLNPKTALVASDIGYHFGKSRSNKMIQEEVGTKKDAIVGDKTLTSANARDDKELANALINKKQEYQKTRLNYERNKRGWQNRIKDLKSEVNKNGL